ncbi:MAG: hypothetical protein ABF330_09985 [Lentimonas sp.]
MLKEISKYSLRSIAFSCLFTSMLSSYAAPQKEAPIDLSIIKQFNELALNMEATQRVNLLKIEARIEQAESDIQSAQFMIDTVVSTFNTKADVAAKNRRGKHLLEEATIRLSESQRELVALLTLVQAERDAEQAKAATQLDFTLKTNTYKKAFTEATEALLDAARTNSYKTVFFEQIYLSDGDDTQVAPSEIRNKVYDRLVEIDGTHFAISVPQGLKIDQSGDSANLTFDNIADYEEDKIALLAIELIEEQSGKSLLYFRLLDLHTHEIIAHRLTIVTDTDALMVSEIATVDEATEQPATVEIRAEDAPKDVPIETSAPGPQLTGVKIRDGNMWIDKLAQQSYKFEVASTTQQPLVTSALLIHTIIEKTSMKIVDSDFILRAYGSEDTPSAKQAGALLMISEADETLTLSARSYSNDRTIEIGTMTPIYE